VAEVAEGEVAGLVASRLPSSIDARTICRVAMGCFAVAGGLVESPRSFGEVFMGSCERG